jgi:glycosyltransferase involved in cell wall biosynthesis
VSRTGSDVVHYGTFATLTLPPWSVLAVPRPVPVIIGPVGGLVRINWSLMRSLSVGMGGIAHEFVRELGVRLTGRSPLTRQIARRADRMLVQSPDESRTLGRHCRPELLSNSGAPATRSDRASDRLAQRFPGRILYAGNLNFVKGVLLLPDIVALLPPAFTLTVYGSGPAHGALATAIEQQGLGDRIDVRGRAHREEVLAAMAESGVFVLPSLREGAPAVVSEAISQGCRFVAFDVGGIAQITKGVHGTALVPATLDRKRAAVAFADEIRRLSAGPSPSATVLETWADKGVRLYGADVAR